MALCGQCLYGHLSVILYRNYTTLHWIFRQQSDAWKSSLNSYLPQTIYYSHADLAFPLFQSDFAC